MSDQWLDRQERLMRGKLYLGEGYQSTRESFYMYRWDGKPRRCPKKGEWYLSGAQIEAYQAPNDLTMEFHIAERVLVTTTPCPHCSGKGMVAKEVGSGDRDKG